MSLPRSLFTGYFNNVFEGATELLMVYPSSGKVTRIEVRVTNGKVNYESLKLVSDRFGTKDISVDGGETGGGCESCDYGNEKYVDVYIKNITKGVSDG